MQATRSASPLLVVLPQTKAATATVSETWLRELTEGLDARWPWWPARYSAYGIGLVLFVSVLLVAALLPTSVSVPPVWELGFVDQVAEPDPHSRTVRTFAIAASPR